MRVKKRQEINITLMRTNYGENNLRQFNIWVKEFGCPDTGKFSLRQLQLLKEILTQKEQDSETNKKGKVKFKANWHAFNDWQDQAHHRYQKTSGGQPRQAGTHSSVSLITLLSINPRK